MAEDRKGTSSDGHKWTWYKDNAGEWRWRRKAKNGEIVGASTEGYKNFKNCYDNSCLPGYDGSEPE